MFSGLPPAVQNTIRAQTGAETIYDIHKTTTPDNQVVYIINFDNPGLPPLYVAPDGSVLNPDFTIAVSAIREDIGTYSGTTAGLKPGDLPPAVMKVIQERAPNTEIAFISKEVWADREVFVISFKDAAHYPSLRIAADGTVLGDARK
jgi:hypothetical protein